MSRSETGLLRWPSLAVGLALLAACSGAKRPGPCAPPTFEAGRRLHPPGEMLALPVSLALRQHEVCWREPKHPGEQRIFLLGNSAVYGHPLPVDQTFEAELDRRLAQQRPSAHVYNLGHVYTYHLKDALILRESLDYAPDLVVYGLTLADLKHRVPVPLPPLRTFFETNAPAVARLAAERPRGLTEPFERYRQVLGPPSPGAPLRAWRQMGRLARLAARAHARRLRHRWFDPSPPPETTMPPEALEETKGEGRYRCPETRQTFRRLFPGRWWEWNVLAYLEQVRARTGADVVVVNLPVAHEPRGGCYNARMPRRAFSRYRGWLEEEARRRSLPLVDLHDLLAPEDFFDSVHPRPAAHRRIAEALLPVTRERLAPRADAAARGRSDELVPDEDGLEDPEGLVGDERGHGAAPPLDHQAFVQTGGAAHQLREIPAQLGQGRRADLLSLGRSALRRHVSPSPAGYRPIREPA